MKCFRFRCCCQPCLWIDKSVPTVASDIIDTNIAHSCPVGGFTPMLTKFVQSNDLYCLCLLLDSGVSMSTLHPDTTGGGRSVLLLLLSLLLLFFCCCCFFLNLKTKTNWLVGMWLRLVEDLHLIKVVSAVSCHGNTDWSHSAVWSVCEFVASMLFVSIHLL